MVAGPGGFIARFHKAVICTARTDNQTCFDSIIDGPRSGRIQNFIDIAPTSKWTGAPPRAVAAKAAGASPPIEPAVAVEAVAKARPKGKRVPTDAAVDEAAHIKGTPTDDSDDGECSPSPPHSDDGECSPPAAKARKVSDADSQDV